MTLRQLAEMVVRLAGRGRVPPSLPLPLARALSTTTEGIARLTRRPPLLPRGQLYFFLWNAIPDSAKAQRELGWQPRPLEEGIRGTLETLDV
jgi:nucleoside-diphosphate-sugar epimerase